MPQFREKVFQASLVLCGLFVPLLLAELYVRYNLSAPPFTTNVCTPEYLQDFEKSLYWRASSEDGRNRLGLKSEDVGEPEPEETRILFLGDSLLWYGETSSGALHTKIIEENLQRQQKDRRLRVINAGIPGWTTFQESLFLKLYGIRMKPDLVVLTFVFNDIYYPYLHIPLCSGELGWHPQIFLNRYDVSPFWKPLFSSSYLVNDVAYRLWYFSSLKKKEIRYGFRYRNDFFRAWHKTPWLKTKTLLQEMQALLKKHEIEFRLVIVPISEQFDMRHDKEDSYLLYPQKKIGEICQSLDIECLDLTETISKKGGTRLYRDYVHFTPEGNDVFADEVSRWLSLQR